MRVIRQRCALQAAAEEERARRTQDHARANADANAAVAAAEALAATKRERTAAIVTDLSLAVSVALEHTKLTASNRDVFAQHVEGLVKRMDALEARAAPLLAEPAASDAGSGGEEDGHELEEALSGLAVTKAS